MSAYGASYNGGAGWEPIGTYTNIFKGDFDGGSYIVTGLFINLPYDSFYTGLFGDVVGGTVQNLGIAGANVTGGYYVGGVAGSVENGTVQNCYVTGSVSGSSNVGGVAGMIHNYGVIQNCCSTATVNGIADVGGVAGGVSTNGTVQNCYSTGAVKGVNGNRAGGVAGSVANSYAKVLNCAALNPSVSAGSDAGRVVGRNNGSGNLSGNVAYSGMTLTGGTASSSATGIHGLDIAAGAITGDIGGRFPVGNGWAVPGDTLHLPGFGGALVEKPAYLLSAPYFTGTGTNANAYQISTAAQLAKLAELVNASDPTYAPAGKFFKLTADIDLSAYGAGYNDGKGWVPIGEIMSQYRGCFDGGGHKITGLYINDTTLDYAGLFGYVGSGGAVKDLGIENASIKGKDYVGGVAGIVNAGTVEGCYVTGSVEGVSYVGGVAGGFRLWHNAKLLQRRRGKRHRLQCRRRGGICSIHRD